MVRKKDSSHCCVGLPADPLSQAATDKTLLARNLRCVLVNQILSCLGAFHSLCWGGICQKEFHRSHCISWGTRVRQLGEGGSRSIIPPPSSCGSRACGDFNVGDGVCRQMLCQTIGIQGACGRSRPRLSRSSRRPRAKWARTRAVRKDLLVLSWECGN